MALAWAVMLLVAVVLPLPYWVPEDEWAASLVFLGGVGTALCILVSAWRSGRRWTFGDFATAAWIWLLFGVVAGSLIFALALYSPSCPF